MLSSAGRRLERIKFQIRTDTGAGDGYGNTVGAWRDLCGPVRAQLVPIIGREEVLAQRLTGVQPFDLRVLRTRETAQVTTDCRAVNVKTGETYDIVDLRNPDERRLELAMLVKRGSADG